MQEVFNPPRPEGSVRLIAVFIFAMPILAQMAEISGTIRDSSEAIVPSAVVTAIQEETNVERSVASSEAGIYVLPLLSPGRLVMPLDSPEGKLPTSSMRASPTLHLQTLLPLVRIETPFDDLFTAKAPPSPPGAEQARPVQPQKEKSSRRFKGSANGKTRASSTPKKK